MNTRLKNPADARNLIACVIGSSGSGKTRFWLTPQILQASADKNGGCSYVCVDPKGGVLSQVGSFCIILLGTTLIPLLSTLF